MDFYLVKIAVEAYRDEWEKLAIVFSGGQMRAAASGASHVPAIQRLIERKAMTKALGTVGGPKASGAELAQVQKALELAKNLGPVKKAPPPPPLHAAA